MEVLKIRKDAQSPWEQVKALVGPAGKDGVDGKDYVLTEADKQEIVQLVLAAMPKAEEVGY